MKSDTEGLKGTNGAELAADEGLGRKGACSLVSIDWDGEGTF